jgi:hypothetical protein
MVNYFYDDEEGVTEVYPFCRIIQEPWSRGFQRWRLGSGDYDARCADVSDATWLTPAGEPLTHLPPPYQRLLGGIPRRERQLAAACDPWQWLALEAMRHVPGFTAFVAQEAAGAGLGYLAACWHLADISRRTPADRLALSARLMERPRAEMLAELSGLPELDAACARLIGRAPPADVTPGFIADLVGLVCHSPAARQAAQSLPRLNRLDLASLRLLPPWMQHPAIAGLIVRDRLGPVWLEQRLTPVIRDCSAEARARLLRALVAAPNKDALLACLERWHDRLSRTLPFPPPPIRGNGLLVPIASAEDLTREGREMRHCVADYADDVRAGIVYYYRWLGDERATVQLAAGEDCGTWLVEEALGVGNAPLSAATLAAIGQVVASQRPAGPLRAPVAGLADYQAATVAGLLKPGHSLVLRREPGNRHDPRAIEVLTVLGVKLGYVPHAVNAEPAARLDRGEAVSAWVLSVSDDGQAGIVMAIGSAIASRQQAAA